MQGSRVNLHTPWVGKVIALLIELLPIFKPLTKWSLLKDLKAELAP